VPTFAAWLAPTTGRHLPATLLHDVLIPRPDGPQQHIASPPGTEADHIYRETVKELGVPLVRRWMIWAAVSLRALWAETGSDGGPRWLLRIRITLVLALILAFGAVVTRDLIDHCNPFPWSEEAWNLKGTVALSHGEVILESATGRGA
jgi:hypothetical protein